MSAMQSFLVKRGAGQLTILLSSLFFVAVAYGMLLEVKIRRFVERSDGSAVFGDPAVGFAVMNIFVLISLALMVLVITWIYGVILRITVGGKLPRFYLPQMYFMISQWPIALFVFAARLVAPDWFLAITQSVVGQRTLSVLSAVVGVALFAILLHVAGILHRQHALWFGGVLLLLNISLVLLSPLVS